MRITANNTVTTPVVANKVKHANAKGLDMTTLSAILDTVQKLIAVKWDKATDVEQKDWTDKAYDLLKERGDNWINTDMRHEVFVTELRGLVTSCEREIGKLLVAKENKAANQSYLLLNKESFAQLSKIVIPKEEDRISAKIKKEEKEMSQEMSVEELVKVLMSKGVSEEVARAEAAKVAKEKAAKSQPVEIEIKASNLKDWFKRAVDKLSSPTKTALVGRLAIERALSKDEEEKEEILAEYNRLTDEKGGDVRFEKLMNGYIIPAKGWKVDNKGKVAGFAYATGDMTQKATSGTINGLAKAAKKTSEVLDKASTSMEESAPKVAAQMRKPFDAAGNLISGINKKDKKEEVAPIEDTTK